MTPTSIRWQADLLQLRELTEANVDRLVDVLTETGALADLMRPRDDDDPRTAALRGIVFGWAWNRCGG